MHEEIERKFLIKTDGWKGKAEPVLFRQGYIARTQERVVRVRVAGELGFITVKLRKGEITRIEFEYSIPLEDANALLDSLGTGEIIEKNRYTFSELGHVWEVDEFLGVNQGLLIAEVELESENEAINLPTWVGEEVSKISKYLNMELSKTPYRGWARNN